MSTFSIKDDQVDVEAVMATIRKRIDEKRKGLYTEQEVREIAEMKLDAVLDAQEFNVDFAQAFRSRDARWNYTFDRETIYASSRGAAGQIIRLLRRIFNPLLKLLFNPNPIIAALSRQSDLNRYYVQLLNNMAVEMTKMNLEVTDLKARLRGLGGRVDFQTRREKTHEEITSRRDSSRDSAAPESTASGESALRKRSRSRRGWRRRPKEGPRPEGTSGGGGGNGGSNEGSSGASGASGE